MLVGEAPHLLPHGALPGGLEAGHGDVIHEAPGRREADQRRRQPGGPRGGDPHLRRQEAHHHVDVDVLAPATPPPPPAQPARPDRPVGPPHTPATSIATPPPSDDPSRCPRAPPPGRARAAMAIVPGWRPLRERATWIPPRRRVQAPAWRRRLRRRRLRRRGSLSRPGPRRGSRPWCSRLSRPSRPRSPQGLRPCRPRLARHVRLGRSSLSAHVIKAGRAGGRDAYKTREGRARRPSPMLLALASRLPRCSSEPQAVAISVSRRRLCPARRPGWPT